MGEVVAISTRPDLPPIRVLAVRVLGEHCVTSFLGFGFTFGGLTPSYAEAARDAVSKIKGATTLRNTRAYYYEETFPWQMWWSSCVRVVGEVGVFE